MTVEGYTPPRARAKRPSTCHYCKAEIVWCVLEGKRQCLDFLPAGGGDVALEPELPGVSTPAELVGARFVGTSTHYRRHLESCPNAAEVRQRWKTRGTARSHTKFERKKIR